MWLFFVVVIVVVVIVIIIIIIISIIIIIDDDDEIVSVYNFCLSVAACKFALVDLFLGCTLQVTWTLKTAKKQQQQQQWRPSSADLMMLRRCLFLLHPFTLNLPGQVQWLTRYSILHGRGITYKASFLRASCGADRILLYSPVCTSCFLKLVVRGFLRVLRFPPFLHWLMVSANKTKWK